jgi:hypothetical protein
MREARKTHYQIELATTMEESDDRPGGIKLSPTMHQSLVDSKTNFSKP